VNDVIDSFLTVDEACEFLRIRKSWLYQNHGHSKMPSHRIGRKLVFKKSELVEWVTGGAQF
jgi:excisionase family DNA binding protein